NSRPTDRSHNLIRRSTVAHRAISSRLSENFVAKYSATPALGALGSRIAATSQILTLLSRLPVASCLPSGDHATDCTVEPCPRILANSLRVATSHNLTVRSAPPVATILPSGEKAIEVASPS